MSFYDCIDPDEGSAVWAKRKIMEALGTDDEDDITVRQIMWVLDAVVGRRPVRMPHQQLELPFSGPLPK